MKWQTNLLIIVFVGLLLTEEKVIGQAEQVFKYRTISIFHKRIFNDGVWSDWGKVDGDNSGILLVVDFPHEKISIYYKLYTATYSMIRWARVVDDEIGKITTISCVDDGNDECRFVLRYPNNSPGQPRFYLEYSTFSLLFYLRDGE